MANGKICYVEIPATDIEQSATFYAKVFGWNIRVRGDGQRAFDDSGAVSGTWVLGRAPSLEPGMLTYIMVDNIIEALNEVANAGRQVVTRRTAIGNGSQAFATFRDPAGNLVGLCQD